MEKMPDNRLCPACMKIHPVEQVIIDEGNIFRGEQVDYKAKYLHCTNTDDHFAYGELIKENDRSFKDAYKNQVGLLSSEEIISIRKKYGISQKDFAKILGWGSSTITRYESHQVQDIVHDDVLRKVGQDPKWFLTLLERAKCSLSSKAYAKYSQNARKAYFADRERYITDSLEAIYAGYGKDCIDFGNTELNIQKVVEVINYFAMQIERVHKVMLMKLLWFADFMHFNKTRQSITGLVYSALPMGAVAEGHQLIMLLQDVCYEEVEYDELKGYRFYCKPGFRYTELNEAELETLNQVVETFSDCTTEELIDKMHQEKAYLETKPCQVISYKYADQLSVS